MPKQPISSYRITKNSTISDIERAKAIYEKLNKNPNTTSNNKKANDEQIKKCDETIKKIKNAVSTHLAVYGLDPATYQSGNAALYSIASLEQFINSETGKTVSFNFQEQIIGVGKSNVKELATTTAKAIFTGKDGKFNTAKVSKASLVAAGAGLVLNPTVAPFIGSVLGTVLPALFAFSPLTTIAVGVFAAAKIAKLASKLLAPMITWGKQKVDIAKEIQEANKEASVIGTNLDPENQASELCDAFKSRLGSETVTSTQDAKRLVADIYALAISDKEKEALKADVEQLNPTAYASIAEYNNLEQEIKNAKASTVVKTSKKNGTTTSVNIPDTRNTATELIAKVRTSTLAEADKNALVGQLKTMDGFKDVLSNNSLKNVFDNTPDGPTGRAGSANTPKQDFIGCYKDVINLLNDASKDDLAIDNAIKGYIDQFKKGSGTSLESQTKLKDFASQLFDTLNVVRQNAKDKGLDRAQTAALQQQILQDYGITSELN